jgi:hypothetical protein
MLQLFSSSIFRVCRLFGGSNGQHLFEGIMANNIEFLGIKFINVAISNKRKQEQKE